MPKTAAQMAANWKSAMSSTTTQQRYKDGIAGTTVNPMALAATPEATQLYLNKIQQSVTSGKRQNKLNAADPNMWKQNAMTVGATALQTGATKASPKVQAHFNKWQPIYMQGQAAAKAIPKDGSIASAMARVQANLTVLMGAAGK